MIDKDLLHGFLFASLYPSQKTDNTKKSGIHTYYPARDKAYDKATKLTDYYIRRTELEKSLPKGVNLPSFEYEARAFFEEEVKNIAPVTRNLLGHSYGENILLNPTEGRLANLWRHLNFKPSSDILKDSLNEFGKIYFTKENIRSLYDALHVLNYIKL